MQQSQPKFLKHIFICENQRAEGSCCGAEGSRLREILKQKIKDKGLSDKIRVSRSGCLDVCAEGPNVLLSPDNIWCKRVQEKDLDEIIKMAVKEIA